MSGLIHIYCGDGKGKTTTSVGLSIRALGNGYNVIFVQFLKSRNSSEIKVLKTLDNITVFRPSIPQKFSHLLNENEKAEIRKDNNLLFQKVIESVKNEKTLLVFDEIIGAIEKNLIDEEIVVDFLKQKPAALEVVLTGRNPTPELVSIADYVSEIKKIKHPFDNGVCAREGIEY